MAEFMARDNLIVRAGPSQNGLQKRCLADAAMRGDAVTEVTIGVPGSMQNLIRDSGSGEQFLLENPDARAQRLKARFVGRRLRYAEGTS